MQQAARNWCETGGLLCEVLAAELAHAAELAGTGPNAGSGQLASRPAHARQAAAAVNGCSAGGGSCGAERVMAAAGPGQAQAAGGGVANGSFCSGSDGSLGAAGALLGTARQGAGCAEAAAQGCTGGSVDVDHSEPQRISGAAQKGAAAAAQPPRPPWPPLAADGAPQLGPAAAQKAVPEPPEEFAPALCGAWAALCALSGRRADGGPPQLAAAQAAETPGGSDCDMVDAAHDLGRPGAASVAATNAPCSAKHPHEQSRSPQEPRTNGTCTACEAREGERKAQQGKEPGAREEAACPRWHSGLRTELPPGVLDGLAEPAGFLACREPAPRYPELSEALRLEVQDTGQALCLL